jgi:subtilisin family serine protease
MARSAHPWHPSSVQHSARLALGRLAVASVLAVTVAAPAAGGTAPGNAADAIGPSGYTGGSPGAPGATAAPGATPLLNLPTSLLVTLRPGQTPEEVDALAADEGLVRVAWNPGLRTAQYVEAGLGAAAGDGEAGPGAATAGDGVGATPAGTGGDVPAAAIRAAGRVVVLERRHLARVGADLATTRGVVAAAIPVLLEPQEDPTPPPEPPAPVAPPNDPYWSQQWGPDAIGARSAWAITRGRQEIVVAVVDTGVDLAHPDLAGRLIPGTDVGAGDSDPSDENGHGTHVTGIIVAASGNARGVSGVAPGVVVMPVKVANDNGSIWDVAVAEGISWAVARGARVVNLSLGGSSSSPVVNAAIDAARAQGVVVAAAAGNHEPGRPDPGVSQPGAYGPALAVAALTDTGASGPPGTPGRYDTAMYSNTGPEVDIAAPGTSILSTIPTWASEDYGFSSGTSMATPFVSAAAALVLARDPSLTAAQVEATLVGAAADLGPAGPDPTTGAGLLRVDRALAAVPAPASDGTAPVVRISGIAEGGLVRGSVPLTFTAADASPIVATRIYRDGTYQRVRRSASVAMSWSSSGVRDGLHRWSAYGTDSGLKVGSSTVRVLVANDRRLASVRTSRLMTATARSIGRSITIGRSGPFVARVRGPGSTSLVLRLYGASGRVVAEARGTGYAGLSLASLRAGRYTLRAAASVAVPGRNLRLSADWFR